MAEPGFVRVVRLLVVVWLTLVESSVQELCGNTCDCIISTDIPGGVHSVNLQCMEGSVSWYNPFGALQVTINPRFKRSEAFRVCFILETGNAVLKVSQEGGTSFNAKSPTDRAKYAMNDERLKLLLTSRGRSQEYCVTSREKVRLYVEPASPGELGAQQVKLFYDVTEPVYDTLSSPLEECRPCSEDEILRSYCSSDFVVVGSMASVKNDGVSESTDLGLDVSQIIRQRGSFFHRVKRDARTLRGTVKAPKKCGITKGQGRFLFTGRVKFGELRVNCAPYLEDWEALVRRAEVEGRLQCGLD